MRLPSWPSTSAGMSFGVCVMKNTPTPLERISRTVWVTESMNALRRLVEQQVCLVEEEDELRLVDIADLGERLEQLGEQPHQRGREELGPLLHGRQLEARDQPAAVGRGAQEIGDLELRLAEELVAPTILEPDERAQEHADRRRREAPDAGELGLALVRGEEREQRTQVGEVEDRQLLLVGVAEDQVEALLLRVVRAEHLAEQLRAEVRDGRTHGHAGPDPAEREVLDGEAGGLERDAEIGRPLAGRPSSARVAMPERSPLTSATNTGTPAAESCSAITCSVFVLPVPVRRRSGRAGCQHERHLHGASRKSCPSCTPRPRSTAAPVVAYAWRSSWRSRRPRRGL